MHPIITKHGLSSALLNGTPLSDLDGKIILTNVQSVQQESGGRKYWNVEGYLHGQDKSVFLKTID